MAMHLFVRRAKKYPKLKMILLTILLKILSVLCIIKCESSIVILKLNDTSAVGTKVFTLVDNKPYVAFYKIPFALPPVHELRFKKPKPLEEWSKYFTYDYTSPYNDTCPSGFNEDCLYLSVYMPLSDDETKTFPVLVWVHEQSNFHRPDFFINEEVLVVTVSYRTSIIGFLNTGDDFAPGNMGAKDILLALKWIRSNILFFNGDPNKVTVVGAGNAANVVSSFLVSFSAEDLFSRIIIQSGSALSPADYNDMQTEILKKLYWKLDISDKFDQKELCKVLSVASTEDLLKAAEDLFDSTEVRNRQRLIHPFGPSIECSKDYFMNKRPSDVYRRGMANNDVEVMFGYTSLEALFKLKRYAKHRKLLKYLNYSPNFQYMLPFEGEPIEYGGEQYKKIQSEIMAFYFINGTIGERSLRRYTKYVSDQVIYPLVRQATLHALGSCNNVYVYRFSFRGALNVGWNDVGDLNFSGATSGDEVCYLFRCDAMDEVYRSASGNKERHFIKQIVRLWANFVKHGNPTPEQRDTVLGNLRWQPFSGSGNLLGLQLGEKIKMARLPEETRMIFWEDMRRKHSSTHEMMNNEPAP